MPSEGLIVFVLGVLGLIGAILFLSVPFMLYSIRSSLQEITETLDDLLEVQLETARRLGPQAESRERRLSSAGDQALDRPQRSPSGRPGAGAEREKAKMSLRQQAERIRRDLKD